ncbi:hypothetical protein AC1031_005831 [Aphanomyces cochlioides]|nr:hypothetical protein AC1031_005831 [Aphanomyces cochlioides]
MTKLVRLVLLLALFLVQTTMAYIPEDLQLQRDMVPYVHKNERGELVEDMMERITAIDPYDKFPTKKKPAKRQFWFAAVGAIARVASTVGRVAKAGVKIAKGVSHARNTVNNHRNNQKKKIL